MTETVSPEMVQRMIALVQKVSSFDAMGRTEAAGLRAEARAIAAELPAPVDPNEALALEMAVAGEAEFVTPYPPARRERLQAQLLAAIKRGRTLATQGDR